ncbi:hypothetical protein AB0A74_23595 [Saccharothrix sp. NPDC042600]|uniref:hypothetical protein n=1 Tax=Saccharothrix TaxID=2071 RepID=UPI0033DA3A22|nr:hypothetical protein GCM10017745_69620 [Saccharothrix mutabilis subsp. capreolus]
MNTFPGRWVGGTALVLGPVLLLTGTLLRSPFHFFFPDQLRAMAEHPGLMTAAYTTFAAGNVVLGLAVVALAQRVARVRPALAAWAGTFVVLGLFERTFHAGVDQAAQSLVRRRGPEFATELVGASYGDPHLFSYLSFTIMFGWYLLAFATYRSGELGIARSVCLATAGLLPLGVLKGTEVVSIVGAVGLCVALVPLGVRVLRDGPRPNRTATLVTVGALPLVGALAFASTLG